MNLTISLTKNFIMKKILGIGNALLDIVSYIDDDSFLDKFSLPKGSMQLVNKSILEKIRIETVMLRSNLASGGSAANTIHGLSMLGNQTGFIGTVGKDDSGDFFESELKIAGVSTYLKRVSNPTGTAIAFVSPDSERTFATHLGAAVELDKDDLNADVLRNYDILYLEGYLIYNRDFVIQACSLAKILQMKVALDLASYNVVEENLNFFKEVIDNYADIIFSNSEEAKAFTGAGPEEALGILSEHCEIAVVKTGPGGSLVKSGNEIIRIKSFPVECRDTTGAGDLYAAGFLHGLAAGKPLEKCGLYGSFLASRVIEVTGARLSNKMWPDIRKKISEL